MAVPPLPFEGNLHCPLQQQEEDVPIAYGDVGGGIDTHRETLRILKGRTDAIAPFNIVVEGQTVAVTPLTNPITGLSSHHILRLINSSDPQGRCKAVDHLIRDDDLYFIAFRRVLNVTEEEIHAGVQANGRWFRFNDIEISLPTFIDAATINLSCAYGPSGLVRPGGDHSLLNMWYTLARFEDNHLINDQFKCAVYNVMVTYCEPRRLKSLQNEIDNRIANNTPPAKLQNELWQKIHYFGKFSKEVLDACVRGTIALNQMLPPRYMNVHGFNTMSGIIGANSNSGELLVVRIDKSRLGLTKDQVNALLRQAGAGHVEEPGFEDQAQEGAGEDHEN